MFTIIAILFVGEVAHVAYLSPTATLLTFQVENNAPGLTQLNTKLQPVLRSAAGKPLICMGAAEGSSLHGVLFEDLVFDESVRRFMHAQPKYILNAQSWSMSTADPATLFRSCAELFPSGRRS
jgi:hypothetical protein